MSQWKGFRLDSHETLSPGACYGVDFVAAGETYPTFVALWATTVSGLRIAIELILFQHEFIYSEQGTITKASQD